MDKYIPTTISTHQYTEHDPVMVSICCAVYNHAPYVRQAIEGFLMQKTNFRVEIIIHDDASTDGSADIIREYAALYPDLIKPILQTENQYSKGQSPIRRFILPILSGKYIAKCEGDDYWTHPDKLQKQVDFLEQNEDCSVCFHAVEVLIEDQSKKNYLYRPRKKPLNNRYHISYAITRGGGFMPTASIVYRSFDMAYYPDWALNAPVGDAPLSLILGTNGNYGFLDIPMSVYRFRLPNSWSNAMQQNKKKIAHCKKMLLMLDGFNQWTAYQYKWYVLKAKYRYVRNLCKSVLKNAVKSIFK